MSTTKYSRSNQYVGKEKAKKLFLKWLERKDPFLYRAARRVHVMRGQNLSGLGEIDWGGLFGSAVETVKTALPAYAQYKQQKELIKMQMQRAEQGLPPLDASNYMPSVKIEPVVNAETEAAIQRVAKNTVEGGVMKFLPWIAAGIAVAVLLLRRPQTRRR